MSSTIGYWNSYINEKDDAFIAFAPTKREAKNKFLLTSKADEGKGCLHDVDRIAQRLITQI